MSPAITATNVSKRYRIGVLENAHDTLAATLAGFVSGPLRNLRRLRRLSRFDDVGQNPEDTIWALQDVSFEVEEGEVLGIIGAAITAVYILRLLANVFFGPISQQWASLRDATRLEGVSTAILVGFLLLVGLMPLPFLRIIESGVETLLKGIPG